ncbi:hypothetical protein [Marivita sp.]|uniref:hypothetical protein n=1 Tax=Marivita sp. TaxID=2003365 RepID=UPI003F71014D
MTRRIGAGTLPKAIGIIFAQHRSFRSGRVPLLKTYLENLNAAAGDRLVAF